MARKNLSVDQLKDLLKNIAPAAAEELRSAVRDEAFYLRGAMLFSVPIDHGKLRNSIRVEASTRSPLRFVVLAGGPLTTRGNPPYDYALAQEFGTQKQSPQPFFFPTYRKRKRAIRTRISQRVKRAIGQVIPLE